MTEPARNATLNAGRDALARRLGGADVRAHGDVHADEAGGGREHGADQEADRGAPAELVVEAEQRGTARPRRPRSSCTACCRYAAAPSCTAPEISRIRSLPGRLARAASRSGRGRTHRDAGADEREQHGMVIEEVHQSSGVQPSQRKRRNGVGARDYAAQAPARCASLRVTGALDRAGSRRGRRRPARRRSRSSVAPSARPRDLALGGVPLGKPRATARRRSPRRPAAPTRSAARSGRARAATSPRSRSISSPESP